MDFVDNRKQITVIKKYPSTRNSFVNGSWKWIEGKRADDNAEGLWRVHDKLYDLTSFVAKHPGGEFWLTITKGTDITEAFESHHITPKAGELLKNYYVREAVDPRNYFLTYDENGFYQTLKKRIAEKLKTVDTSVTRKSKLFHDVNLVLLLVFVILLNRAEDFKMYLLWTFLTGQCLAWSSTISQNFVHQADNWRMYTSNFSLINWRELRIFHVLSHHMYPNTYADFEISCYDSYFKWMPLYRKTLYYKVLTLILGPLLYLNYFHNMWRLRIQGSIWGKEKVLFWDEVIGCLLPIVMILTGKEPVTTSYLITIYLNWGYLTITGQFLFLMVHFNRGHHGAVQLYQNDEIKSFDFGQFQLSTTVDRVEANYNTFTILAYSGEQVLHHLFPTIDSAILPQLKDTFLKTCKEFKIRPLPETTMLKATIDQFKQLFKSNVTTPKSCYSSNASSYFLLGTIYVIYKYWW